MKTMKMKMNRISLFWIFGLFWICLNGNSQETKLSRQERKEVRKAQLAANFNVLDSLLNSKSFVLEADFLQDSYGNRIPVVSNLNFIKVDGSNGILQTGTNSGLGYNGVGGVTAEGTTGSWEINKDIKKLYYSVQFSIITNIGQYDIFMNVMADDHARATISGLGPGKLTWEGHLETVNNSRIFKGQETI
jgi:hypothetical protein